MNPGALLVIIFFLLLSLRIPIAFSLGFSAIVTGFVTGLITPITVVQTIYTASDSFPLLAIPFFVLAGDLMLTGGVSKRLINFALAIFGNIHGALGIVTVMACMIFAAISGSGPATTAAIGGPMIPYMIKEGYNREYSCTLAACSGAMGPIIPPSIAFIIYGVVASVSITDLFIGGFLPGILISIFLCMYTYFSSKKHGFGKPTGAKFSRKAKLQALNEAKWSLAMPVIILGGIYCGVFTPTEAAVVGCLYGLLVGFLIYKEIKIKDLFHIVSRSAMTTGMCLILVGMANIFGRIMVLGKVSQSIADFVLGISDNVFVLLLIINILLLIVGCFMECLAAIIIFAPLLLPIIEPLGISPLTFGVIGSKPFDWNVYSPCRGQPFCRRWHWKNIN
jgi:C4-dicarboxylate transporter DctM subunit